MNYDNTYEDFGIIGIDPTLANADGEIPVICPQCDHYRKKKGQKKLSVNIRKAVWRCNHCNWSGGLTPEGFSVGKKQVHPSDLMPLTKVQIEYFAKRGISLRTLNARGCKYKHISLRQKKNGEFKNRDCIAFLYREKGLLRMIKYRDGNKNFKIEKDSELIPYGIDWIMNSDEAIITEGEIDVLSYHEVNLPHVCSVPNGTTISKEEKEIFIRTGKLIDENALSLKYFDRTYQYFENKKTIYIATDNDPAGIKLRNEIARRFGYERCKIIDFSLCMYEEDGKKHECNDPNEVLMKLGPDALRATIKNAKDFPINDVITVDDSWSEISNQYEHGLSKGKPTGYESLAAHLTWGFGHLITVNGHGNNGKSFGVFNLIILASILYGWKWGLYLPENYPVSDLFMTFMEIWLGNTLDRDKEGRASYEDMEKAKLFIKDHFELVNNEKGYSPEELRAVAKRMIMQRGIVGFVTDPWNSLNHVWKTNQDNYLENELSAEQRFAINNNIIKIIVAHPNTPQGDARTNPKCPSIFEYNGGSVWSKKAYEMLAFHIHDKNADEILTELHIQKCKWWKLTGIPTQPSNPVILKFKGRSNRFLEGPLHDEDPFERAKQLTIDEIEEDEDLTIF